jgi:transposase
MTVCKRIVEDGEKISALSEELGIHENTLYKWSGRYRKNSEKPFVGSGGGHALPENEEMVKLRREIRDLREENEILKKAAAYFAKHQK